MQSARDLDLRRAHGRGGCRTGARLRQDEEWDPAVEAGNSDADRDAIPTMRRMMRATAALRRYLRSAVPILGFAHHCLGRSEAPLDSRTIKAFTEPMAKCHCRFEACTGAICLALRLPHLSEYVERLGLGIRI